MTADVDHIAYATLDLDVGVAELEALLGVRASAGGRHPAWGTHNALLSLGPATYLEVVAPDPARPGREPPRLFGLDTLERPRLSAWAARASGLEERVASARDSGVRLGDVQRGARVSADGDEVTWVLTDPLVHLGDGLVPFLIDWEGTGSHPAHSAAAGCTLVSLRAEHPEPSTVRAALAALGVELEVAAGPAPALIATLDTPRGVVALR